MIQLKIYLVAGKYNKVRMIHLLHKTLLEISLQFTLQVILALLPSVLLTPSCSIYMPGNVSFKPYSMQLPDETVV